MKESFWKCPICGCLGDDNKEKSTHPKRLATGRDHEISQIEDFKNTKYDFRLNWVGKY